MFLGSYFESLSSEGDKDPQKRREDAIEIGEGGVVSYSRAHPPKNVYIVISLGD